MAFTSDIRDLNVMHKQNYYLRTLRNTTIVRNRIKIVPKVLIVQSC
jgi:hypothetical protein